MVQALPLIPVLGKAEAGGSLSGEVQYGLYTNFQGSQIYIVRHCLNPPPSNPQINIQNKVIIKLEKKKWAWKMAPQVVSVFGAQA